MDTVQFVKMHGLGNDFVVVDCISHDYDVEALVEHAQELCKRSFGIGADGLILVLPGTKAPYRMRIINSDGSEPEMCGNGIRCFAKYLYDHGLTRETTLHVETLAGVIVPVISVEDGLVKSVSVNMGPPRLERGEVPMLGESGTVINEALHISGDTAFDITVLSMGNPHAVLFVNDVDHFPVEQYGPLIEQHPAFPRRTNVEFAQVISAEHIKMRVWERGAGITLACGTGACATLVAAVLSGHARRDATVELPGGSLHIVWSEHDNNVYMTGPAEEVFTGVIALNA